MDQIKSGTVVVEFSDRGMDIEAGRPHKVQAESPHGMYIVHDTRTALIEALKARFEALKDGAPESPAAMEQYQVSLLLRGAYRIEAATVPGPSTVTFTELANNP